MKHFSKHILSILGLLVFSTIGFAQTTAFNFQGRLNDGSQPANGRYDLQFKLFAVIVGGSQVGTTVDRPGLVLVNGVFSTTLDFGGSAFTGSDRFVEISVRPNGSPNAHVILGGRQQIMSVPFAVRSVIATQADNATNAQNAQSASDSSSLGGVAASNYARLNFPKTGNLQTSGNVGFGTVAPNTRLTLSGGPSWTSSSWTASMNMQNASALGWEANSTGQRFGVGQTNNGLNFFRTISGFGSTLTPAQGDLLITNNGDLSQPVDRNGGVKAMIAVTADGSIVRCYNGVTGVSAGNCGFTVNASQTGSRVVTFGFPVANRFLYVTADLEQTGGFGEAVVANAGIDAGGSAYVVLKNTSNTRVNSAFHLIVF